MTELIADLDVQHCENMLKRLTIRLMDVLNEIDCYLRSMLVQFLCFYANVAMNTA
ncbi:unnamed protein product, partial [Rotaria sp. Silwood1]